jgi:hypothetical protein
MKKQRDEANPIVASFPDREPADAAVCALHDAGYRSTWLAYVEPVDPNTFGGAGGTVGAGRELVRPIGENPIRKLIRSDTKETLYDALRAQGMTDEDARNVDGRVVEGSCVLVADGASDPLAAEEIMVQAGGSIVSAPTPLGAEPDRESLLKKSRAKRIDGSEPPES